MLALPPPLRSIRSRSAKTLRNAAFTGAVALAAVIGVPGSAWATATSATGAVEIVPAPQSVADGAYESNTAIRVFDETQVTISSGPIPGGAALFAPPQTVTCLQSHMIHFDAAGTSRPRLSGTVTFSQDIVAIIRTNRPFGFLFRPLDLTDRIFGAHDTTYHSLGDARRGVEFFGDDVITVDMRDRKTVAVNLGGDGFDEVRVLTNCDVPPADVPEVPLNVLLPLGGLAVIGGGYGWSHRGRSRRNVSVGA